ncbi:MAG: type II toxin-antitoxin system RelE/ParE family toxin [Desulfatirhabdiaceae bacterium]
MKGRSDHDNPSNGPGFDVAAQSSASSWVLVTPPGGAMLNSLKSESGCFRQHGNKYKIVIEKLSSRIQTKIIKDIEIMGNDLTGDVKQLTNFTPEYRLRVGDYRVLFEIENKRIIVYRVRHRREVYR